MPPNVKEVASALASLDLSNHLVASKYAPLTSEVEASSAAEQSVSQQQQQHPPAKAAFAAAVQEERDEEAEAEEYVTSDNDMATEESYWDMPHVPEETEEDRRQKLIEQILREEEIRQTLSIGHIEQSLVEAAAEKKLHDDDEYVTRADADADGYWDMVEPTTEHEAEQDEELEQDEASAADDDRLSTSQIEKLLLAEGRRLDALRSSSDDEYVTAPHVNDPTHPMTSYWDWDTSPKTDEQKRSETIRFILEEDAARKKLSVASIEKTLIKPSITLDDNTGAVRSDATNVQEGTQAYWNWSSREKDQIEAPHVHDPNHPDHTTAVDYWTWTNDEPPKSPEEQRDVIIEWILREDAARRATSLDVMEGRLRAEAAERVAAHPQPRATVEVVRNAAAAAGGAEAEGYWDW